MEPRGKGSGAGDGDTSVKSLAGGGDGGGFGPSLTRISPKGTGRTTAGRAFGGDPYTTNGKGSGARLALCSSVICCFARLRKHHALLSDLETRPASRGGRRFGLPSPLAGARFWLYITTSPGCACSNLTGEAIAERARLAKSSSSPAARSSFRFSLVPSLRRA
jgi:hypothetical protein